MEGFDRWGVGVTAAILPWVNGSELRAGKELLKEFTLGFSLDTKIMKQMGKRGWTESKIIDALGSKKTAPAIDKATGEAATAYFIDANQYVVRNNKTGKIIQISDLNDPSWKVDSTIRISSKK